MSTVTNLTQQQIEKIQIDEGVVFINYGEADERLLAPTRGGGEFSVTNTIRDIEFDGRRGKTKGMQVIEEQAALLKIVSLCMSQTELALAIPGCVVTGAGDAAEIANGDSGLIPETSYLKNITMFAKLLSGAYKKIQIYNAMHEGALTAKASQKAEGELSLEFNAHFNPQDNTEKLYKISEASSFSSPLFVSALTATSTKIAVTFNNEIAATGLVASDFAVKVSDVANVVTAVALNGANAKIVELTITTAITSGKTVTVAYTKGTAKSVSGVLLESFTAKPVENTI